VLGAGVGFDCTGLAANASIEARKRSSKKSQMRTNIFAGALVPTDRKLPGIHGLRAVAALAILFMHVAAFMFMAAAVPVSRRESVWLDLGGTGVHLFFVLSGFSLARSWRPVPSALADYAIRRFCRIAPLFYALLVVQQLWRGPHGLVENILNASFLFNLTPHFALGIVDGSWTIGAEMLFYAMLPILLVACRTVAGAAATAVAGLMVSWAAHIAASPDPALNPVALYGYATFCAATNVGAFSIGLLAFRLHQTWAGSRLVARAALALAAALFAAVVLSPALYQFYAPGRPAVLVLFAAYGLLCLSQGIRPSWFTTNAVMQHVGERSFSVYLMQFPVMTLLMPIYARIEADLGGFGASAYLACAVLTVPIVLVVANLTYHAIELPGMKLGQWLIARRSSRAAYQAMPGQAPSSANGS